MAQGPANRSEAQRRADQIRAFRAELADAASEGVEPPPAEWLASMVAHQDALLAESAAHFDIDQSDTQKRMSLGMGVATLLGAVALVAAVVSFFDRIWGSLGAGAQVAALTAAPLASVGAMVVAARRERTLYVASIFAIVSCAAFVMQLVMLGQLFNTTGSVHVIVVVGLFALSLGLAYELSIPFVIGVVALITYAAALTVVAMGGYWGTFIDDAPEVILLPSAVAAFAASYAPAGVRMWGRAVALAMLLVPLLVLTTTGTASLLPWSPDAIEAFYQVVAVLVAIVTIAVGLKVGYPEVFGIGSTFAAIFLLLRFIDWWWDWMPRYLFFLLMAALALLFLWAMRLARRRMTEASA